MDRDRDELRDEEYRGQPDEMENEQGSDDELTRVMNLLFYLKKALMDGSSMPLTSKRLVDVTMCLHICGNIEENLPLAIQYADQVFEDREMILTQAHRKVAEADRTAENKLESANARALAIVDKANQQAQQMLNDAEDRAKRIVVSAESHARGLVDQNAIKIAAQNEARDIINAARAEANDRRQSAGAYCDDLHIDTEKALQAALDIVRNHRQKMREN